MDDKVNGNQIKDIKAIEEEIVEPKSGLEKKLKMPLKVLTWHGGNTKELKVYLDNDSTYSIDKNLNLTIYYHGSKDNKTFVKNGQVVIEGINNYFSADRNDFLDFVAQALKCL